MEQLEKQDRTIRKLKKQLKVYSKRIGEMGGTRFIHLSVEDENINDGGVWCSKLLADCSMESVSQRVKPRARHLRDRWWTNPSTLSTSLAGRKTSKGCWNTRKRMKWSWLKISFWVRSDSNSHEARGKFSGTFYCYSRFTSCQAFIKGIYVNFTWETV